MEGFGIPGAIPTRNNNPGDLEHAPGETHPADAPDSVGSFATPEIGWDRLEDQLKEDAARNYTIQELIEKYAPPSENNTANYLQFVCDYVPCNPNDLVSDVLKL
jgi:hypothetical protein